MIKTHLAATRWHNEWYDRNPERLILEQQIMRERFPQFTLVRQGQQVCWMGKLTTNKNNVYEIAVMYPPEFPGTPPDVYPIDPPIAVFKSGWSGALKHQYNNGRMCLYYPGDRNLQKETTAAVMVALAAAWLFAYECWLDSGKREWPGNEAD